MLSQAILAGSVGIDAIRDSLARVCTDAGAFVMDQGSLRGVVFATLPDGRGRRAVLVLDAPDGDEPGVVILGGPEAGSRSLVAAIAEANRGRLEAVDSRDRGRFFPD